MSGECGRFQAEGGYIDIQQRQFSSTKRLEMAVILTRKALYVVHVAHYFICFVSIISTEVLSGL